MGCTFIAMTNSLVFRDKSKSERISLVRNPFNDNDDQVCGIFGPSRTASLQSRQLFETGPILMMMMMEMMMMMAMMIMVAIMIMVMLMMMMIVLVGVVEEECSLEHFLSSTRPFNFFLHCSPLSDLCIHNHDGDGDGDGGDSHCNR